MSTAIGSDRPADSGEREQAAADAGSPSGSELESPLYGADPDRSFRCPCCLELREQHDRHHWTYPREDGSDVGVYLCRACHMAVHGDHRVAVQRRRSHTSDWRDDALARLIARHRAIWGTLPPGGMAGWYTIPVARSRILHAIPRSLDPALVAAATPDDSGDSGGSPSVSTPTPMNPDP